MKNILVPTDFSEYANNAFDFACSIAEHSKGEVTLLHVLEYPVMSVFNTTGEISMDSITDAYIVNLKKRADEELDKKLVNPAYPDVRIKKHIRIGNPYENIARLIQQSDADLVVMGTKGASGLRELFIGSNAEKAVRFSKCPVITVPGKFDFNAIKKLAYGITFEDNHNDALFELKKYLHLFKAELHLVWVNTLYDKITDTEARSKMDQLAKLHMLPNYSVNCYKSSAADDGLLFYAEENNIDMIALATHSRKGLAHIFAGSFAEDVVNHSIRPVWTFSLKSENLKAKTNEKQKQYQ